MPDPLVLYSTNTLLAYRINERYYQQLHFVWCNPFFSSAGLSRIDFAMPPSATPCDICRTFLDDVSRQDRHSAAIERNRSGVRKGIEAKEIEEIINKEQAREIKGIVEGSSLEDFRPLLYIIPFEAVRSQARLVSPGERAHPFSQEYTIDRLHRSKFDVLEWLWR